MTFNKLFKKHRFEYSENQAVFTYCHIIRENKPILYIKHDAEGDWQFLCGATHTAEDARIIAMKEVIDLDSSVGKIILNLNANNLLKDKARTTNGT